MSDARSGTDTAGLPAAVTCGLLAAWALHDVEEIATMRRWARARVPELRERWPEVPDRLWDRLESVGTREFALAVGCVGVLVAAASADGHRTGGRSALYQSVLTGFGLHGLVHLAQAAATRGYTPGAATSPTLVLPFTLWARHRLRTAGVLRPTTPRAAATSLAVAGAVAAGANAAARRIVRRRAGP
ncbi:HXXEE domain-containing protein [Streptomyces sp. NPDC048172]|uniref:HXXEE domain-containing protein n=1 Tax=Streptomyces sp. NPDC048172 TaxID=3365505 RepID=UPI003717A807